MKSPGLRAALLVLGFAVGSAQAHETGPLPATGSQRLLCRYTLDLRQHLANGDAPHNRFDRKDVPFDIDFEHAQVSRSGQSFPASVTAETVDFRIGDMAYALSRRSGRLRGEARSQSLAGDSLVQLDGHCHPDKHQAR